VTNEGGAPDGELVRQFQGGDESAFVTLMQRHERRIYNLAYRMVGRVEDARDATQDAFVSAYRHLGAFRGDAAFGTWLHRIAVNACYDLLRKRPAMTVPFEEQIGDRPSGVDPAERATASADVQRALLSIPQEFRAVLILHEVQDLPVEEIAEALGIPSGTVKSRLHRGRVALGKALAGDDLGGGEMVAGSSSQEPSPASAPSKGPSS
jgi:RNA polymerase sigma-70 factor (ECF subfamily)